MLIPVLFYYLDILLMHLFCMVISDKSFSKALTLKARELFYYLFSYKQLFHNLAQGCQTCFRQRAKVSTHDTCRVTSLSRK